MSTGALMMLLVAGMSVGCMIFLLFAMARSIRDERSPGRSVWREFGLSIVLFSLFAMTWLGHGVAQWQRFTDEAAEHGETPAIGDFVSDFTTSTLENWQSEFLQLFSFVTLAALYIHKGSAESKDGEENIEASLRRIEEHLGTLPRSAPQDAAEAWKLPETPLEVEDRQLAER